LLQYSESGQRLSLFVAKFWKRLDKGNRGVIETRNAVEMLDAHGEAGQKRWKRMGEQVKEMLQIDGDA
jgi:hypothetical protein